MENHKISHCNCVCITSFTRNFKLNGIYDRNIYYFKIGGMSGSIKYIFVLNQRPKTDEMCSTVFEVLTDFLKILVNIF